MDILLLVYFALALAFVDGNIDLVIVMVGLADNMVLVVGSIGLGLWNSLEL
jgi:hypothetical protein